MSASECKNVREIVVEWLEENGYDGLWCPGTTEYTACEGCTLPLCGLCLNGNCRPGVLKDGKIVGREPKSHHEKRTDEDIKEEDDRKMNLDGNDFGDS
jgi:hypothetical protein